MGKWDGAGCRKCGVPLGEDPGDGLGTDLCAECFNAMLAAVGQPKPFEMADAAERRQEAEEARIMGRR